MVCNIFNIPIDPEIQNPVTLFVSCMPTFLRETVKESLTTTTGLTEEILSEKILKNAPQFLDPILELIEIYETKIKEENPTITAIDLNQKINKLVFELLFLIPKERLIQKISEKINGFQDQLDPAIQPKKFIISFNIFDCIISQKIKLPRRRLLLAVPIHLRDLITLTIRNGRIEKEFFEILINNNPPLIDLLLTLHTTYGETASSLIGLLFLTPREFLYQTIIEKTKTHLKPINPPLVFDRISAKAEKDMPDLLFKNKLREYVMTKSLLRSLELSI